MSHIEDFSKFAELLPEAMLLVSGTGEILAGNRWAAAMLAVPPGQGPAGRSLASFAAGGPEPVERWLKSCARTRALMPGALKLRKGDGSVAVYRVSGGVYEPASQEGPAVVLVRMQPLEPSLDPFLKLNLRIEELTTEIARRRRAESELRTERERLRVTLESIGDAVIATDPAGVVTFLNPVAEILTGWNLDEARGRALEEVFVIVNEHTLDAVENPVARVMREEVVVGLANHTILIRRDGTWIPIDDSGAPIRDSAGDLAGVVLVFHDITQRRQLERELEARNRTLVEADRRKDEFLAMLAHELRNPLAPLRSGTDILRLRHDPQSVLQLADMMDRQVTHLARLVDDLLDVSRITRGNIALHRAPASLQSILHHALEMMARQIEAQQHRLVVKLPDEEMMVDGDSTRLTQLFSNLLSNAAKFTDPGGRIELSATHGGDEHVVRVQDTGIGLEPWQLNEVFDLFAQVDQSLERGRGGLGLGLTVARRVAEMHGGSIEAFSEGIGKGSEFVVVLPSLRAGEQAPGSAGAADADARVSRPRRVLVVDDNHDAAAALGELLTLWGHDVRIAHDGPSALEAAAEWLPEAVLLDLGLPGIDGFEVARRMRGNIDLNGTRIVAVTGYGRPEDRDVAAQAGFDDHLTKPVDPEVVARLVEEL